MGVENGWSGHPHPPDKELWEKIGNTERKPLTLEEELEMQKLLQEADKTYLEIAQDKKDNIYVLEGADSTMLDYEIDQLQKGIQLRDIIIEEKQSKLD